jgi:UDP-N-acetylglucosamine--N-acetylmuramyl-(pentapeptide) pyrophosphoryl-undecaprenol N-acetylglucosamine transferase
MDEDGPRTGPERREAALRRELWRTRNSASFRLGHHLVEAIRKPWKLLVLPFTLPVIAWGLVMELLGRRARPMSDSMIQLRGGPARSVVLFPTNGVGFGHFTRMYALARRLRKKDPDLEIVFFTTQPTLHLPYAEGFPTYHLAGPTRMKGMDADAWNAMCQEMLTLVLETHRPQSFVFDGAFPYRGMLDALSTIDVPQKVWVRRGMFRKGSSIPVDAIGRFDLIVHPGDAVPHGANEVDHGVEELHVPPMLLIDPDEMWSRDAARRRLGVPNDARVVYVQLGAGRINDIDSDVRRVVDALLEHDDVHVVLGESMLGERLEVDMERVHLVRDYPNALYLKAFDAAVQAGGYNSFHEMRSVGLPTLFLPNMNTGMDDQLARCTVAEEEGWGLVLRHSTEMRDFIFALLSKKPVSVPSSENGSFVLAEFLSEKEV